MKKIVLTFLMLFSLMTYSQTQTQQVPQVNVTGEGKVKIVPDQCTISLGVENTGKDAAEVKKANDVIVEKVIKYIKGYGIPQTDFQTTNVSLNKTYDYEKKKNTFYANQTLTITLKDIKKYDDFMMGITDTGITNINGVEFKSSKMEETEREARKKAMLNAKSKASDLVGALGQKLGKIMSISDNSSSYYPQPQFGVAMMKSAEAMPRETLAVGEISVVVNVQVSFVIE